MSVLIPPETENYWRYELKYLLSYHQYQQVKNSLYPYIVPDHYTEIVPDHKYLVRSLYFDTPDYQSYNEKIEGRHSRFRLRIRTYSKAKDEKTEIRVEIKVRNGEKTEKHGTFVSTDAYDDFMKQYHWDSESNPVLIEFERNAHARILRPKILVEYYREGYKARGREDVRITFDHNVQSAQTKNLFPTSAFFRQHYPHQIVLEIKHREKYPDWLKQIVQTHSLKIVTNSKYCQGIEVTQPDLVNHALRV